MRGHEDALHLLRDLVEVDVPFRGDPLHELPGVPAPARATRTKSSLTSGISAPAWLRMKATANSGSIPPEQPAKIEIVPVGATVVRLQLRSRRSGRIRVPSGPRAQLASGPQIEASHAGKTPRAAASRSEATRDSSFTNSHHAASEPHTFRGVVGNADTDEEIRPSHDAEPDRRMFCASSVIAGSG